MVEYIGAFQVPKQEWKNYGDVNPIEHGGVWVKPDQPTFPGCFYIVKNIPMDDTFGWWVQDAYIDLSDDWIDWPKVYSYADIDWATDPTIKAIAVFDYYGPLEFQGESKTVYRESELIEALEEWEIEVE